MRITYLQTDVKKEVTKQIKDFAPTDIYMFYEFDRLNCTGLLRIQCSKDYYDKNVTMNIFKDFTYEYGNVKFLTISRIEMDDILLSNFLLEQTYCIEPYAKNLKNFTFKDNSFTDYWEDTIIVKNKTKKINHSEICFDRNKMITLYSDEETRKIYELINAKNIEV